MRRDLDEAIVRLSVLDDPARRAAYLAVRTADGPLSRAEVADAVGISVRLATFHLERLLSEGFLESTYARDEGPGVVGHPAKRYRPTALELAVAIPPRRYDLAAEILAEALDRGPADPPQEALADVAAEYGRQVGRQMTADSGDGRLLTALRNLGYEPAIDGDDVVLRNCPFRRVAQAQPDVICGMNVAFVAGVVTGTQTPALRAVLAPSPERCCVVVAP
jgi:predicted ArsR family transcriptional regulator